MRWLAAVLVMALVSLLASAYAVEFRGPGLDLDMKPDWPKPPATSPAHSRVWQATPLVRPAAAVWYDPSHEATA